MSIKYSECVPVYFCLGHPACKVHAPYCYLWPVLLYHIFLHYLINGTTFGGGEVSEHKMCDLILLTTFVSNISRSMKKSAKYYHECTQIYV